MSELPNEHTCILSFYPASNSSLFKFLCVNCAVHIKQDITTFHCGKKFNGMVKFRGTYHGHENYQATLRHLVSSLMLFMDSREAVFEKSCHLIGLAK